MGAVLELLRNTPIERFLDTMAVRLDGAKAAERHTVINLVLSDTGDSHVLELANVQHLHTPVTARLPEGVRLLDVDPGKATNRTVSSPIPRSRSSRRRSCGSGFSPTSVRLKRVL